MSLSLLPRVRRQRTRRRLAAGLSAAALTAACVMPLAPTVAAEDTTTTTTSSATSSTTKELPDPSTSQSKASSSADLWGSSGSWPQPEPSPAEPTETTKPSPSPKPSPEPEPSSPSRCSASEGVNISGDVSWGVRESFRKYIKGPIAKGSWKVSSPAKENNGSFIFPIDKGFVTTGEVKGLIRSEGKVEFNGHGGLLKTIFEDPVVEMTSPRTAKLFTSMYSQDPEGNPVKELDKEVYFADLEFRTAPIASGTHVAEARITEDGSQALSGFYDAGDALDPVTLTIKVKKACGTAPKPTPGDSGGDSSNSGKKPQPGRETDNGNSDNSRPGGGDSEAPAGGNAGGDPFGDAPWGADTPGNTDSDGGIVPPNAPGASGNAGGTKPVAAAPGQSASARTCNGVSSGQVAWGVKQSFRSYIRGSIAKGGWRTSGVRDNGGIFVFSGRSGSFDPDARAGTIATSGTVAFNGHKGKLDMKIRNPRVVIKGNTGQLVANVTSSDTSGNPSNFGDVAIGTLQVTSLNATSSAVSGSANVVLTQAGSRAFAEFYPPGTAMDPVNFRAKLSGKSACADGSAATSSSAGGTGGMASIGAAAADALATGDSVDAVDLNGDGVIDEEELAEGEGEEESMFEEGKDVEFKNKKKNKKAEDTALASVSEGMSPWQLLAGGVVFIFAAAGTSYLAVRQKKGA